MDKTTLTIVKGTKEIGDIREIIEEIVIPDGVEYINHDAFAYCTSLTKITLPDSVKSIGVRAFEGCSSLTEIVIPNSVTEICGSAFRDCTSLKAIYIDKEKGSLSLGYTAIPENCKVYWKGEF